MACFEAAHAKAIAAKLDHLTVDAAHMIAIVKGAQGLAQEALEWNHRALRLAEGAPRDPDGFLWELWSHNPAAVARVLLGSARRVRSA